MALVAGSYERFIWGFSLKTLTATSDSSSPSLAPLFSYPAHAGPIRCVAAAPRTGLAASGGADDSVRLYDLPAAADLGPLLDPAAAVSALAFHSAAPGVPRNLLAASDDGLLHLYDADGFALLASLRVFPRAREPTDALAVHASGRLALAVGRAGGLALLNLLRGRRSFACRLERPASAVAYAAGGDRFVMAAEEKVTVHDSEDARVIHEMRCDSRKRVLAIAPSKNGLLYTGGEDRGITAWDLSSGKVSSRIEGAHATRVKGVVVFDNQNDGSELSTLVASASSDGVIRIWDARMTGNENPTPLAEVNTKARLTCLAGTSLK